MHDLNPYHTESTPVMIVDATPRRLPGRILTIAVLDLLIGLGFGLGFLQGAATGGFYDHWVSVTFAGVLILITILFIGSAIGLVSLQPLGWWLGIMSHCLFLGCLFLLYLGVLYLLVDTWGVDNRYYKGGSPSSVAIVTAIFFCIASFVSLPIFVLCQRRVRRLYTKRRLVSTR